MLPMLQVHVRDPDMEAPWQPEEPLLLAPENKLVRYARYAQMFRLDLFVSFDIWDFQQLKYSFDMWYLTIQIQFMRIDEDCIS